MTTLVGQYLEGARPYGLLDAVGHVVQWTSSLFLTQRLDVQAPAAASSRVR